MDKMNKKTKGTIVAGIILFATLGMFVIKNYLFGAGAGLKVPTIIDAILILPAMPFLTLIWVFPESIATVTTISFILATIFWLAVGYFIGNYLDKKNK